MFLSNQDGSPICMLNVRTLDRSTPVHGRDEWIASQRDSLVRIFHVLAQARESTGQDQDLFGSCSKQLTLSNRQSSSLKTPRESEQKAGGRSSAPLWRGDIPGVMERLLPLMSARAIREIDGGALLPTLTVCGNWNRKGASKNSGDGLSTALRNMPTLLSSDGNRGPTKAERPNSGGPNLHTALKRLQTQSLPQETLQGAATGYRLTPDFAEWWMGWPIRWTALKPAETGKCPSRQR